MAQEVRKGWGTEADAKEINKNMTEHIYKRLGDLKEEPHPTNKNVKLKFILTRKDDGVEITALLGRTPKGEVVPEHTHEVHDILLPIKGKAKVWIKGLGDFELKPGVVINVPPGALHKLYDVTEDLEVYDIFSGPIE